MAEIKFILDGEETTATEGETILDVARRLGKHIPTLCHDPRLEPFTSCYVCLVELEGRPGFVPSCGTKVAAGMKVRTDSPDVRSARKLALELLMSAHNADCVAPCRLQCPDNTDIQTYIAHIAAGEFAEALKTIKRTNPFPSVCGRVCPHTCELQCRRNRVDEPVAINPLKRFVADLDLKSAQPYIPEVAPDAENPEYDFPRTGKKVAVVGGGPAGLTAAYYLRQNGHAVTVFEMNPKAGGMLRYGIPRYRLPDDVLDREIAHILATGVELRCNQRLGHDFTLADLKQQGYDAVFLAVGAWTSSKLDVPGEERPGVLAGIDFLRQVASDQAPPVGGHVVVVGGGNTAVDAARTARRLGADVTILYRRTRQEMPAEAYEVDEAEREGVYMHFLAAPVALASDNGRVGRLRAIRMELGEPDSSGRRRPVPVEGSEFEIEAETVIAAIGQRPEAKSWLGELAPTATRWSTVQANETTYQTDVPWVFTGGDCLTGAATAIEAIAGGRKAAISIDRYLRGLKLLPIGKPFSDCIGRLEDLDEDMFADVARAPRCQGSCLPLDQRVCSFQEVEIGIDLAQALTEAGRCLSCGCAAVDTCKLRQYSQDYEVAPDRFEVQFRHRRVRDDHPFILYDPNKCIICGRCVRICLEQQGLGALGFVDRGFDTAIQPSLGQPLLATTCDACGQCVGTCPSGALEAKRVLPKPGPYQPDCTPVACGFCSVGCRLTLEATRGRYIQATTEPGTYHNRGNLCVDGSFAHRYLETLPRLQSPRVRQAEENPQYDSPQTSSREVDWDEAIRAAAGGLTRARSGGGVAVLVNGPLTNEDSYLLARLARTALRSNRILSLDGPADPVAFHHSLPAERSRVSLSDLMVADLVWVLGTDPFEFAPVAGIELLRAARAGVPLTVIGSHITRLDEAARRVLRIADRDLVAVLAGLAEFADSGSTGSLADLAERTGIKPLRLIQVARELEASQRPVIVCTDNLGVEAATALGSLLASVGASERLLLLRRGGNGQGREMMGLHPSLLPGALEAGEASNRALLADLWGNQPMLEPGLDGAAILRAVKDGSLDGLLLINTDPYGTPLLATDVHPDVFTVVLDLATSSLGDRADVLLPSAGLAESSGTIMTFDRLVLPTSAVRAPVGGRILFQTLEQLAAAMGEPMPFKKPAQIWQQLERLAPGLGDFAPDKLELSGKSWSVHLEQHMAELEVSAVSSTLLIPPGGHL